MWAYRLNSQRLLKTQLHKLLILLLHNTVFFHFSNQLFRVKVVIFTATGVRGGAVGWGTALQTCKVAGSIPDAVTGIFHWHSPSGRTMALRSNQPLTEMSTRNISWEVKAAGALCWLPYYLHVPSVLKSGSINLLEPSGPVQACNGIAVPFTISSDCDSRKKPVGLRR